MNELLKKIELKIKDALVKNGYDDEVVVNFSSRVDLGEFQYNGIMKLAKVYGKNPREIAEEVVNTLKEDKFFKDVNVAGPGFINITIDDSELLAFINKTIDNFSMFIPNINKKKIVIDYGGANAAKALHVGHMRSANIGEALKRLIKIFDNEVISDVQLGDLGRQS